MIEPNIPIDEFLQQSLPFPGTQMNIDSAPYFLSGLLPAYSTTLDQQLSYELDRLATTGGDASTGGTSYLPPNQQIRSPQVPPYASHVLAPTWFSDNTAAISPDLLDDYTPAVPTANFNSHVPSFLSNRNDGSITQPYPEERIQIIYDSPIPSLPLPTTSLSDQSNVSSMVSGFCGSSWPWIARY